MDRILKLILIVIVLSALASCGIFFTPIEGRWNTADPKSELETFNPSLDGYVEGTTWNDGPSIPLITLGTSKLILMKFDTSNFPKTVAASYLRLRLSNSAENAVELFVHRITYSWDSGIDYGTASAPRSFYDDSTEVKFTVPSTLKAGDDIQIPITEIFSGDRDGLKNGIIIMNSSDADLQEFDSTESGTAPVLLIEPE